MKKIPTLFERKFENHHVTEILPNVTNGMEWVLDGEGIATVKMDGSCCAIINGEFYKRYDAKNGKPVPEGAIKCQDEPDPVTGHLPCWVKVKENDPDDKWFMIAYNNYREEQCRIDISTLGEPKKYCYGALDGGTYEAIGKHFCGNPYNLNNDILVKHGEIKIDVERSFNGIRKYLSEHYIEGIVFWKYGEPRCKIKRTDFGFEWNGKNK